MKKIIKFLVVVLIVVFSFSLVACSGFNKVEKTLNGLGYYESGIQYEDLRKIDDETNVEVQRVLFTNLSKGSVMVFEFESIEDAEESVKDDAVEEGAFDTAFDEDEEVTLPVEEEDE